MSEPLVSLELRNAPLSQVLSLLGAQTGWRVRYAVVPDAEVSVSLREAPLRPALRDLLNSAGFVGTLQENTLWVMRDAAALRGSGGAPAQRSQEAGSFRDSRAVRPGVGSDHEHSALASSLSSASSQGMGLTASALWQWWSGGAAPPEGWMLPPSASGPQQWSATLSGSLSGSTDSLPPNPSASRPRGSLPPQVPGLEDIAVRLVAPVTGARDGVFWKDTTISAGLAPSVKAPSEGAPRRGVAARSTENTVLWTARAASSSSSREGASREGAQKPGAFWARWPMRLRMVPRRCQLVLSSDRPANVYVNGARLLRNWSGSRTLDLSSTLSEGLNVLAVEWLSSPGSSASPPRTPKFSFEWLVSS
jgi:hypothetical protein